MPTIPEHQVNPDLPHPDIVSVQRIDYVGNFSTQHVVAARMGLTDSNRFVFKLSDIRRILQMLKYGEIHDFPVRYLKTAPPLPTTIFHNNNNTAFCVNYNSNTDEIVFKRLDAWNNKWVDTVESEVPSKFRVEWKAYQIARLEFKKADNYKWSVLPFHEVLFFLAGRCRDAIDTHNMNVYRYVTQIKGTTTEGRNERAHVRSLVAPILRDGNTMSWSSICELFNGYYSETVHSMNPRAFREFMSKLPKKYRIRKHWRIGDLVVILRRWYTAKYDEHLPGWRLFIDRITTDNYYFSPTPDDVVTGHVRTDYLANRHALADILGVDYDQDIENGTLTFSDGTYRTLDMHFRKSDIRAGHFPKCACCITRVPVSHIGWFMNSSYTDSPLPMAARTPLRTLVQQYSKPHPHYPIDARVVDLEGPPELNPVMDLPAPDIFATHVEATVALNESTDVETTIKILRKIMTRNPADDPARRSSHISRLRAHGMPAKYISGWTTHSAVLSRGIDPSALVPLCTMCSNLLFYNREMQRRAVSDPAIRLLEQNGRNTIRNYSFNPMDVYQGFQLAKGELMIKEYVKKWSTTGKSFTEKVVDRTPYFGIELEVTPGIEAFNLIDLDRYKRGLTHAATYSNLACHIAAEITEKFLRNSCLGVLKQDGSVHGGFELVTIPGTHKWHTEEGWKGFFKEDFPKEQQHLAPSYYLSGWQNNNIEIRHPFLGVQRTPTCGIHIHMSRDALSPMQFGKLLNFVNNPVNKPFIELVAGRGENSYTGFNAKDVKAGAKFMQFANGTGYTHRRGNVGYADDMMHGRYTAVNVNTQGKKTIEFRIFRSNVAKAGFMKNIDFVHALAAWCNVASYTKLTVPEFLNFVDKNRGQYKWLSAWLVDEQRIKRIHKINEKFTQQKEFAA